MADIPTLGELKTMVDVPDDDKSLDAKLEQIIKNTNLQLKFKLGLRTSESIPPELGYIPMEVCIKRYNRLKNEGMSSYQQEGETITFNANDFDEFLGDIDQWKKQNGTGILTTVDPYRRRWYAL